MWMDADSDEEGLNEEDDSAYDTVGDAEWDLQADRVYWRRRFLILCAGVVALGVCAWLIPGANPPSARSAAGARRVAALNKGQALPAVAYDGAWASAAGAPLCAPSAIVLSLFTSQASYAQGARPAFSVYAVSTAAAACTLSFGAGAVRVIVTRNGHVAWDSAACRPAPARPARFALGVPQVLALTWDSRATRPAGCGGSLTAGESGTFDAVAMIHGQSSPVRAFTIDGLPAEGGLERLAHVLHLDNLHRRPGRGAAG
jgi:hypothetical protein